MSTKPKGRGKGAVTKAKEELKKVQTAAMALDQAHQENMQKIEAKKPLEQKIKDFLLEKLKDIDILEATAIIGATYVIKNGIDWTEKIAKDAVIGFIDSPLYPLIVKGYGLDVILNWIAPPGGDLSQTQKEDALKKNIQGNLGIEILEWFMSFTAAFLIVRYFGQILDLGKDIIGMAKNILGLAILAV